MVLAFVLTVLIAPLGLALCLPHLPDWRTYDAWRDDLAVPDPYATEWEPVYSHGPVKPTEPDEVGDQW
jgi:hypothetical protein